MPELNPEQRRAVAHGNGPLLVVAGPGTGKTRVITERIVHLLSGEAGFAPPLQPENILALTFTEKAAGEMKHRIAKALPDLETAPAISTFHAFCYQILCKHHQERLLLDKIDVWIFLRRRMAQLGLNFYQKLAEPGAFLHDLNDFFSRCQDELIEPDDFDSYVRQCEREFFTRHPDLKQTAQPMPAAESLEWENILKKKELAHVFHASRRMIEESGSSSLGSLVSETVALWQRDPAALDQTRAQFRAVLVDEFQDTNYAQAEMLKLLVPPPYAITAVGDDDQAIYRFRGASHGAFEMFSQAFPGHQTVYLTQNYRSTQRILRAAGAVIAHNDRYAQKAALTSQSSEGPSVHLVKAQNPEDEAAWITDEIERLARKGISYGSMAVLYRAHNYRDLLVRELNLRSVPLSIRGLSILSATVLRDLVAWLRVIHSPHDNISLTRVLLAPCWRIPESRAQLIREHASRDHCSLYDVLTNKATPEIAEDMAATGWDELQKLLKIFRRLARSSGVTGLAAKLTERLGWLDSANAQEQRYLETFHKFLSQWEEKSETRRLAEFIDYFNYFLEAGGKIEAPESPANAVQMMTVHAAKGLEFPVVFVIGVSPRRFPTTERKPVIEFPSALRKGPTPPRDIHLQEERRLFFVALTRAQQRLYVSSVSKSERQQSIFIQDLLSDPAVRTRDLEIIEAPERGILPAPAAMHSQNPFSQKTKLLLSETAIEQQGRLFDNAAAEARGLHPSISDWAASSPAKTAEGKLHLSATSAEDYLACPLKYKFQHIFKIPTAPQAALTFGNLMHQSVRRYFELRGNSNGLLPSFDQIEQFYLSHWKGAGFDDKYQEETYRKAGLDQLRAFVEKHNTLAIDTAKIQMEQSFEMNIENVVLEGRIDQINQVKRAQNGAPGDSPDVELIDYKTGRARTQKDADKSLQLSVYALAAKNIFRLRPSRVTLYNLTTNEAVSAARAPQELESAVEKIHEAAAGIASGDFPAAPGFICRWCNYVPICPAHEGL